MELKTTREALNEIVSLNSVQTYNFKSKQITIDDIDLANSTISPDPSSWSVYEAGKQIDATLENIFTVLLDGRTDTYATVSSGVDFTVIIDMRLKNSKLISGCFVLGDYGAYQITLDIGGTTVNKTSFAFSPSIVEGIKLTIGTKSSGSGFDITYYVTLRDITTYMEGGYVGVYNSSGEVINPATWDVQTSIESYVTQIKTKLDTILNLDLLAFNNSILDLFKPVSNSGEVTAVNNTTGLIVDLDTGGRPFVELYYNVSGSATIEIYGSSDGTTWRKTSELVISSAEEKSVAFNNGFKWFRANCITTGIDVTIEISATR